MTRNQRFCLCAVAATALVAPAWPDVAAIFPAKDNTIIQSDPGFEFSNGEGAYFFVGRTNSTIDNVRRGVIKFDVAAHVPAGSTITEVTLRVHVSKTVVGAQPVRVQRMLADWGEGPSDAGAPGGGGTLAATGDVSWRFRFYPSVPWGTFGGEFSSTVSTQFSLGGVGSYTFPSTTQLVADTQSFLDQPTQNFGWILLGNENIRSAKRLDSRENPTPENWPCLTVTYTPPPIHPPGDMNCDGLATVSDIAGFVLALTSPAGYAAEYPDCAISNADLNGDQAVSVSDIGFFVQLLTGG